MNFDAMINENKMMNYEGGEAIALTAEMELYTAVVTASLSPTYYEDTDNCIKRICGLVEKCDPRFVAQLAVYTRNTMNLRSVPLLLVVELARIHNGDDLVARTVERVVERADEIMELLTCYQIRNAKPGAMKKLGKLSRQIQNGLQRAFNKFDEYQFGKYNRESREVTLRDALFLIHPKAKDEAQQEIFNKIANKTLATPYTWETELSALGQQKFESDDDKAAAFTAKWSELVASGKLGYMALLRNLRNILNSNGITSDTINTVANRLCDKSAIARSKQLPFRYLSAFREVANVDSSWTQLILNSLELAADITAANIAGFDENTKVLIASDVSGSMYSPISRNSSIYNYDIGLLLAMMLRSRCKQVYGGIFGDDWKLVNLPSQNILSGVGEMKKVCNTVGFSTNGYKVINWLIQRNEVVDKVMFFTDMQMWNSCGNTQLSDVWHKYKQIAPNAKLYLFDLCGYGQSPINMAERDVYLLAGWSDKIFDILYAIEHGSDAISEIMKIEL